MYDDAPGNPVNYNEEAKYAPANGHDLIDRNMEGLAEELNSLNIGIRELVHRRSLVRKELAKQLNTMGERIGKLDDIYYNLTRGEGDSEGMPMDSAIDPMPREYKRY